jgi:transposase
MMIIGCDFHPSWQQVSWLDTETGEVGERKLVHASGDAKRFYEQLAEPVLVGMEATGNSQWFIERVELPPRSPCPFSVQMPGCQMTPQNLR